MKAIRWSRDAQRDFAEIDDYYQSLNPEYSHRIATQSVRAARLLAVHREAGERLAEGSIRQCRVPGTRSVMLYRLEGDFVLVIRVNHAARDWDNLI